MEPLVPHAGLFEKAPPILLDELYLEIAPFTSEVLPFMESCRSSIIKSYLTSAFNDNIRVDAAEFAVNLAGSGFVQSTLLDLAVIYVEIQHYCAAVDKDEEDLNVVISEVHTVSCILRSLLIRPSFRLPSLRYIRNKLKIIVKFYKNPVPCIMKTIDRVKHFVKLYRKIHRLAVEMARKYFIHEQRYRAKGKEGKELERRLWKMIRSYSRIVTRVINGPSLLNLPQMVGGLRMHLLRTVMPHLMKSNWKLRHAQKKMKLIDAKWQQLQTEDIWARPSNFCCCVFVMALIFAIWGKTVVDLKVTDPADPVYFSQFN